MYFNYHAKLRKLIAEGHLVRTAVVADYNGIRPALIFYFDSAPPMPVREYRWPEYADYLPQEASPSAEEQ